MRRIFILFLLFSLSANVLADRLKVVSWNVAAMSSEQIDQLIVEGKFGQAANNLSADVYILQEVLSYDNALKIAKALGFSDHYIAVSNFSILRSDKPYYALETAVISKIPIKSVIEFDPKNDSNLHDLGSYIKSPNNKLRTVSQEVDLKPVEIANEDLSGVRKSKVPKQSRGFMRVELENDIVIYPLHFKSNRMASCQIFSDLSFYAKEAENYFNSRSEIGSNLEIESANKEFKNVLANFYKNQAGIRDALVEDARQNARKREHLAAMLIKTIKENDNPDKHLVIAAGDLNAPWYEKCVTGKDITEDTTPKKLNCDTPRFFEKDKKDEYVKPQCDSRDGFDDTHAILMGAFDSTVALIPLTDELNRRTYTSERFVNSPIDHFYVWGKNTDKVTKAFISSKTLSFLEKKQGKKTKIWGSDHLPLSIEVVTP